MKDPFLSDRMLCLLGGLSGAVGVVLLIVSFVINSAPPAGLTPTELIEWGKQHYASGLWGAWLQAIAPVLIVLFAFSLVHLAGAAGSVVGSMTFFGGTVLTTVSLIEITFYLAAWHVEPSIMPSISLRFISAAQHLYFVVGGPALFTPLGIVILRSTVLPRGFGFVSLLLAAIFAAVGAVFALTLTLPTPVLALAGVQGLWWLSAAVVLMARALRTHSKA